MWVGILLFFAPCDFSFSSGARVLTTFGTCSYADALFHRFFFVTYMPQGPRFVLPTDSLNVLLTASLALEPQRGPRGSDAWYVYCDRPTSRLRRSTLLKKESQDLPPARDIDPIFATGQTLEPGSPGAPRCAHSLAKQVQAFRDCLGPHLSKGMARRVRRSSPLLPYVKSFAFRSAGPMHLLLC